MASLEETEITFQTQENVASDTAADLTSFQFVPEKIVDFHVSEDGGQRSYRVQWKDSWLTEELLSLTYQHLINDFWAAAVQASKPREPIKKKKKVQRKPIQFETQYQPIAPQPTIGTSATNKDDSSITFKGVTESQVATDQLINQSTSNNINSQTIKVVNESVVDTNSLSTIVVNTDVPLSVNEIQYHDINPALLNQAIPKYQQALQQPVTIQQQDLVPDEQGKVTFPKHVFSQARFSGKKQQSQPTTDQQRVQCDICQKSLKTKKMLWAHKVAVHFGGNFPCEICGKKCITGAELRRHMSSHSSERKFVCQYCGLSYKRWSHLYQHLRVHEEEKNFRCDVCHNNFKVQSELKDHCFSEHSDGQIVKCSVCHHKLQTPLAVYYHSMKHTGTREFVCEICGSNFKRKQHLVTHMKTHLTDKRVNDGDPEVYNCQACDEKFALKMDLKSHCDEAHPCDGTDGTVNCKTCEKKLNLSHSVYLHGLRHCGTRNFKCTECDQLFKRKAHLLRHQMDRHPTEPRERKKRSVHTDSIICTLCTKSFVYKASLIKHMASLHGIYPRSDGEIVVPKSLRKRHQCDVCQKRFKVKANLKKHKLNRHSDNVPVENNQHTETQSTDLIEEETQEKSVMVDLSITEDIPIDHSKNTSEMDADITSDIYNEQVSSISTVDPSTSYAGVLDTEKKFKDDTITIYTSTQGHQSVLAAMPQQVITVDQETGNIILMQAEHLSQASILQPANTSNLKKENLLSLSGANSTPHASSSIENSINNVAITPSVSQLNENNVAVVEMIDDSNTPLNAITDSLQDSQNVIDFSQSNTEQIVVLLSALNAQNIDNLQ